MTGQQIRVQILRLLADHESKGNGVAVLDSVALAKITGIPESEIRRHLDILADAKLITAFKSHTGYGAKVAPSGWKDLDTSAVGGPILPLELKVSDRVSRVEDSVATPRTLRVFLCHASSDKNEIRVLYKRLKGDQMRPWLDEEDLLPGQDWELEIQRAVRTTDVVLVCLSARSVNKVGFLQKEIRYVLDVADEQLEGTIFLIPVRLEDCHVPDRLRRWHWVSLYEESGYDKLLRALRERARTLNLREPLPPVASSPLLPSGYRAEVLQTGGIGSRLVTKIAWLLDEHGYLNPVDDYVVHSFNGPGDVMWARCREGYRITQADSPTGNEVFPFDENRPDLPYGIRIKDQLKNTITITCQHL